LSTEGETRLLRGRHVYGGGGSSTEGETRLQRARLFCRGTDSYTEWETSLWRGRLVYGGGDSSTEGETRLQRDGSSRDYTRCYRECSEWPEHSTYNAPALSRICILRMRTHNGDKILTTSQFVHRRRVMAFLFDSLPC
jgi:hypothetical protein